MSKPQRDLRIGYGALGVGAAAFVLLTVATLTLGDTDLPGVPVAQPPGLVVPDAQQVIDARVLVRPASAGPVGPGASGPAAGGLGGAGEAPVPPGGSAGPEQGPEPGPEPGSEPGPGDGPGTDPAPPDDPDPGTPPGEPRQGAVSALLDPVVEAVVTGVDGLTGGALAPVTGAVQETTDGLTDVVDGLLGGRVLGGRP
ncbi:hypothetical protein GGQ22_09085 [Nocardioides sp. zg-579]|uniref:Uncharacterized protein n=1 Tax=Nocardioides marmotae TaxID=2663857 RepID=A0A6I3JAV6_9ACTN|nr:hypothetical protein [Nocardioides marmotae]MCR6031600.1 hypothetical protein [Gordonia jinghuaiqii]MTB95239.1 hypothetical protein [Nocardioides marmotae]QKE02286.1 hypothetical protein HPC71_15310 [Nocardioides marmotae]